MSHNASRASSLSDDLWARIFSIVAQDMFVDLETAVISEDNNPDELLIHKHYQSLRSVCKVFRAVFLSRPELSADLFLKPTQTPTAVMSLLEHLRRDDLRIRRLFAEYGSILLDVTLAGALAAANRPIQMLESVFVQQCSVVSLDMFSTCTALTSCTLTDNTCQLDLSALQALPNLAVLRLHRGTANERFLGIGKLQHLTRLDLQGADVQADKEQDKCLFCDSLQELFVEESRLWGMGEDGLSQCTALQSLLLLDCVIGQDTLEHKMDIMNLHPASLPDSLSALNQLTELRLMVAAKIDGVFECPWLFKLTALKHLDLHFLRGKMRFNLTEQILSLTNLEYLGIDQVSQAHSPETILSLEASLHLLPLLRHVIFYPRFLKVDCRVLGLVKLSSLQILDFSRCQSLDDTSAYYLMVLMHNMGAKRPDVLCYLGVCTAEKALAQFEQAL